VQPVGLSVPLWRSGLYIASGLARRCLGVAASVACGVALATLAALGLLAALGYSVLIDRSDSMRPAIDVGDLVVTKRARPGDLGKGDVVTFKDHARDGLLVTHRVRSVRERAGRFSFVTKGDRNGGSERWSIDGDGTVGAFVLRVPKAGYVVSVFTTPVARFVFLTLFGLLLGVMAVRRIWRD
jgi:signal peptidase I